MRDWKQNLLCPYCWNSQDQDYWEGGMTEIYKCEFCQKSFVVHTTEAVLFSTEKMETELDDEN